ncbi:glycosyltransferase [Agrococcus sp. ProA11]|uniref:glycosyltransferase n=1 Tax=Agrococcus chionoecetis TaxID=3153752 RepID=UPI0032601150
MRLLLVTAGTRGDVEPFVALARRALARGHEVVLAAPDGSGADLDGIDVRSLGVDYSRLIAEQGTSVVAAARSFRTVVRPLMHAVLVESARIGLEVAPDVVVHHPKILSAPMLASRVGAASVLAELVPTVTPTRAFPAAGTAPGSLGPFNRLTYAAAAGAAAMFRGELRAAAAVLGSDEVAPTAATLVPVSPSILARPADWPADVHLTGAWMSEADPKPLDPTVDAFLNRGASAVIGFGSMAGGDALTRGRALVGAARSRGLQSLVMRGWGGVDVPPDALGDDVLVVDQAPHALVLPRAAVAVHHGGAGTVHAAVRAGAPSIVVPFLADQPFWARILHRSRLAAAPLRRRGLSERAAGRAIDEALGLREHVRRAAAAMEREDGTGSAMEIIERLR